MAYEQTNFCVFGISERSFTSFAKIALLRVKLKPAEFSNITKNDSISQTAHEISS